MKNILQEVIFSIIIPVLIFAQTDKERIAVLNLEPVGISEIESITLTDRLRSEIMRTGSFMLLERSKMSDILEEQGFQMTGCTSNECAVEAGKLLNVSQICAGSVGKVGAIYTVAIRLIDVETGAVVKTVTEDCKCSVEQVLTISVRNVAYKLSGKIPPDVLTNEPGKITGDIFIKSTPSEADIYLDGFNIGMKTPATIRGVTVGNHEISVIKKDKSNSINVLVKANDILYEDLKLDIGTGPLKIYSNPPEAEVYLEDKLMGKTPLILRDLNMGENVLKFKKEGYATLKEHVNLGINKTTVVDVVLHKAGKTNISIETIPPEALILIDGKSYGKAPTVIKNIPTGDLTLLLKKEGFADYKKDIKAIEGNTININAKLLKWAKIDIESEPHDASIYLNGKQIQKGNESILVPPDEEIKIKLKKYNYSDWEKSIILKENEHKIIEAKMNKLNGILKINKYIPGTVLEMDGSDHPLNNNETNIPVGNHIINLKSPGHYDKQLGIIVKADQTLEIDGYLKSKTKTAAITRSVFLPGWGQMYQDKNVRSVFLMLSLTGATAGSVWYTLSYNNAVKDYNDIRDKYNDAYEIDLIDNLRSQMDDAYHNVKNNEKTRNNFFIAAGAIWFINMVDVIFLPPDWDKKVTLSSRQDVNSVMALNVSWQW
ncbi:MAG: PEGA domain-containing protein [Calditrichaceae bacterium]|nr:PEGA domain-containing protein [Calditrichaceae bacterium]MBN2709847.1 PEGA domain-containing protein [Calditrichaceae bacterium]RQV95832.1 MAG: PEGA domain-containing protein [Calditrichota bacterium]